MRKLFATTFGLSALLALLIGAAVYAWTGSANGNFNATTGRLGPFALANFSNTGNQVFPTGDFINEQNGQIRNNTSANPGIAVHITGGSVSNVSSSSVQCNSFIANDGLGKPGIDGQVRVTDSSNVGPGGQAGGGWGADLRMKTNAPVDCQAQLLSYTVTVNVAT